MTRTMKLLVVLLLVVVAGGGTAFYLTSEDDDGDTGEGSANPTVAETTPPPVRGGVRIVAKDFSFSTRLLSIPPGSDQLLVQVTNKGESPHTFGIQDPTSFKRVFVSDRIPPGQTRDIVIPRLPGEMTEGVTFPFFCSLHFNKGMRGVVLVTGGTPSPEASDT